MSWSLMGVKWLSNFYYSREYILQFFILNQVLWELLVFFHCLPLVYHNHIALQALEYHYRI